LDNLGDSAANQAAVASVRFWPKADTRIIAEYEEIGSDLKKIGEFFWDQKLGNCKEHDRVAYI